ncbi:MAG: translation initiation factor IF-2 [Endomicrobium sp.]|jgi:translation initiation factor IF-2|nr:translation initiation factor IF-2 [Endomicrobium sp.]
MLKKQNNENKIVKKKVLKSFKKKTNKSQSINLVDTKKSPKLKLQEQSFKIKKTKKTSLIKKNQNNLVKRKKQLNTKHKCKIKQPLKFNIEKSKNKYIVLVNNELITITELAKKMNLKERSVLKKFILISNSVTATVDQKLDIDTAIILASEFNYNVKKESVKKITTFTKQNIPELKQRFPIVTIMGHVDHGKTSLLDSIRNSNIANYEHGGITQHIGAYRVKNNKTGQYILFLDTPGHEAFTAMRCRGTQITDIVVLVISAVDNVMPQTVEAINHANAANVPIIVAINKIDLPSADPEKIKKELTNYNLVSEEWGGDTIMVNVSAKEKINIDLLLEMILLKSEMMELKTDPNKNAEGIVIEASLDQRKGPLAMLLVQNGTLKVGDNLLVGTTYGKVRAITDEYGTRINMAMSGIPIWILGINEPPQAGDKFIVVKYESEARKIAKIRKEKTKKKSQESNNHLSLVNIATKKTKTLKIILKADVQGSIGAITDVLEKLSTSEISLKIIHKGAGIITESDVALAVASDALIIGFNLRPDSNVEKFAESEKVNINTYRVIYNLIDDVKAAMEGLLTPYIKEEIIGKAIVKQIFKFPDHKIIFGCYVIDGKIQKNANTRLLRDNIIIFEGNILSLKIHKNDVKEIEKGYEFGIGLEKFIDVKIGDIIENYTTNKIIRKLSS